MKKESLFQIKNLKEKTIFFSIFTLGVLFLWFSGIHCVFRYFLGIVCPGCGMTRAAIAVLHLDFASAFRFHPMFWSVPILFGAVLFDGKITGFRWVDLFIFSGIGLGFAVHWLIQLL